jgi:ribonucleotide reductase beta subunit family protein with ferritin-like domain
MYNKEAADVLHDMYFQLTHDDGDWDNLTDEKQKLFEQLWEGFKTSNRMRIDNLMSLLKEGSFTKLEFRNGL